MYLKEEEAGEGAGEGADSTFKERISPIPPFLSFALPDITGGGGIKLWEVFSAL